MVVNLPTPTKKGFVSQTFKPKSAKKGDNSFKACSDIGPYKEGLPLISNIAFESSPHPSAKAHSSKRSTTARPRPPTLKPFVDAPLSSRTHGSKRKISFLALSATTERRACYL